MTSSDHADGRDPVDELVFECLERLGTEGSSAIDSLCTQHPAHAEELRARVAALREAGLFPADGDDPQAFPEQLGDFRLLRRLGGGGMGVVYQAEQISLGREVALKLIRPDYLYFPQSRERFRREVLAVASLQHPGIVPVYAGGEEAGVPYFAMEMIRGCTLADVLEELGGRAPESLTSNDLVRAIAARAADQAEPREESASPAGWVETCLKIAIQVAHALAHAHARGIVHRDVKPSNIAITTDLRAMLLDFGLTSSGSQVDRVTMSGSQVGTLLYMSPEQARGASNLDARTDVYSLGVTLYELLTLQTPYRGDDHRETQKQILDGRPDAIRPRNRRVSTDAETVCLKAMDRDIARRYASTTALAQDLENVLEFRPITARRPGVLLRAKRFAQRRPATTVAIALGLAIVLVLPTALYVQERRALAQIRREAEIASQVTEFLVQLFESASPGRTLGEDVRLRPILEQGAKSIEYGLETQPVVRARLLSTFGRVYRFLGSYEKAERLLRDAAVSLDQLEDVDGELRREVRWTLARVRSALGFYDEAAREFGALLVELEQTHGPVHPNVVDCMVDLAEPLYQIGRHEEAERMLRDALERAIALHDGDHWRLAMSRHQLATLLVNTNRPAMGKPLFVEALAMRRRLFPRGGPVVVDNLCSLGRCLTEIGEFDAAEQTLLEALEQAHRIFAEDHPEIAGVEITYAHFLGVVGRPRGGIEPLQRALMILENAYGDDHPLVAWCLNDLGVRLHRLARTSEANDALTRAETIYRQLHPEGHRDLAIAMENRAEVEAALGLATAAEKRARDAIEMFRQVTGEDSPHTGNALVVLAGILAHRGYSTDAEELARDGLAIAKNHPNRQTELGIAHRCLALLLNLRGDGEAAEAEARLALELLQDRLPPDHPDIGYAMYHIGWAQISQKDPGAEKWLQDSIALLRRSYPDGHSGLAFPLDHLGVLRLRQGRPEQARPPLEEALMLRRRFLPAGSHWVSISINNLSVALVALEADDAARPLLEELLERHSVLPRPHPELAAALHFSAFAELRGGDLDTARQRATDALEQRRELYPERSVLRADTASLLGAIKIELGAFPAAEALLLPAHATLEQTQGPKNKLTKRARRRLAELYERWGKPDEAKRFRSP